jgi:hypothetical protein
MLLRYMSLEVCWDGLWTLSFGLSQFHGHGTWLVCEVVLTHEIEGPWHRCMRRPWLAPHALSHHDFQMTVVPCFLDETIEKFMDYNP